MSTKSDIDAISKRFRQSVENSGLTYRDIAARTGIPMATIQRYVTGGTAKLPIDKMKVIANAVGVDPAWIMGWSDNPYPNIPNAAPVPKGNMIPLYPACGAGGFRVADDYMEGYVPCDIDADFAVRIDGDSMAPTLLRGDIALVKSQADVDDGDIAIVLNGEEAVCKRVMHLPNGILCVSDNEAYEPFRLKDAKILGKVRGLRREF